ncbi:uncharacterized protein TNCV_4688001 [Trichonephila clavipes]|nr:uncharacterized protein TNCV_4688001 [Trichonephila clavipes]
MHSAFAVGGTINSRRATSVFIDSVERKRGGRPLTTPKVFCLKIVVEPSQSFKVLESDPPIMCRVGFALNLSRLQVLVLYKENAMANAFWVSVRNNISKRWNTTENDVSKNQSSGDQIGYLRTSHLSESYIDVSGVLYHVNCTRSIPSQSLHELEQSPVGMQGPWIHEVVSIPVHDHQLD